MTWLSYSAISNEMENSSLEWLDIPLPRSSQDIHIPFLIENDGTPCTHGNLFLLETSIFKGHTEKTIQTYAESLCSFFTCLYENRIVWTDVDKYDLLAYREALRNPSNNSDAVEPETVNLRLTTIDSLYNWAISRYPGIVFNFEGIYGDRPHKIKTPRLKSFDSVVEIASGIDALEFISNMPEPYDLMAKWQLVTGLRASGIRGLSVENIRRARPCNGSVMKMVIKEKPSKPRNIYPPKFLIDETNSYIRNTRKVNLKNTLIRHTNKEYESFVFLNSRGNPISGSSYYGAFYKCSDYCDTKIRSHMLRSTFATNIYAVLRNLEHDGLNINSLLVVRELLGHSWMSTTEKYINNTEVEIAVDSLYKSNKNIYFLNLAKAHLEGEI